MRLKSVGILAFVIFLITFLGAIPRLYRITEGPQFLGDQGRDALRVARIFKETDLVFIGPVTSIGNMYLAPAYYYFMLPWLWLSYPSPLGPALAVAALSIVTIPLLYYWGRELVGRRAAVFASVFFAFSWTAIEYARFSWNPNPAPFVALLMMWALYRAMTKNIRYWLLVAVSFGLIIQLHYVALLTLLPIIIVALLQSLVVIRPQSKLKHLIFSSVTYCPRLRTLAVMFTTSLLIVLALLSPLIAFDVKYDGINLRALQNLVAGSDSIARSSAQSLSSRLLEIAEDSQGRTAHVVLDLVNGQVGAPSFWMAMVLLLLAAVSVVRRRQLPPGELIVYLFIGAAIVGASIYSHSLFDHYILFVMPAVVLFYGILLAQLSKMGRGGVVMALIILSAFLYRAISQYSFDPTYHTLSQLQRAAVLITDKLYPGEPYNVVLLSQTRDYYGQNFRYFLDTIADKEPLDPDRDDLAAANTVVIINEEGMDRSTITSLPIFELNGLTDAMLRDQLQLDSGITVFIYDRSLSQ